MDSCKPKKYIDGYLEKKESSKWVNYWAVLRGKQLIFYRDQNTDITENITSYVDLGCYSSCTSKSSKANKFDFELKTKGGKKHQLRASSDLLRLQWLYALGCAAQGKPSADFSGEDELLYEQATESDTLHLNQKASNPYSEVPNFTMGSNVASGMSDKDMQKEIDMKKPHPPTFKAHCKKMWTKNKALSLDSSACSLGPHNEEAEASEAFYDPVPDNPPWYVGKITREKAENLLENCAIGTFLVRDSESVQKAGAYTLTLKHSQSVRHHKIETLNDGQLVIRGREEPSPNLATLIKSFARSRAYEINLIPYIKQKEEETPSGTNKYERMNSPTLPPKPAEPAVVPKHSYENLPHNKKAPPPIIRRETEPVLHGYENVPSKDKKPLTKTSSNQYHRGYENLPEKDPPPLPPSHDVPHGYENLPSKSPKAHSLPIGVPPLPPRSSPNPVHGYQNLPPAARSPTRNLPPYQNVPPKVPPRSITRATTLPAHLMEETLRNSGY